MTNLSSDSEVSQRSAVADSDATEDSDIANPQHGHRPNYCWKFQDGNCSYQHCRYIHRCERCDSSDHGKCECPKRRKLNVESNDYHPDED